MDESVEGMAGAQVLMWILEESVLDLALVLPQDSFGAK